MINRIKYLIQNGENSKVEFKEAKYDFPRTAYESICAFLNGNGGVVILGVNDNADIIGISPKHWTNIQTNFVSAMNNTQFISPTIALRLEKIEIDGKLVGYIEVPNASSVYRYKSRIYLRNGAADIDITDNQEQVSRLYLQKDNTYSENQIFPYLPITELREDLIVRVKRLAKINDVQNDWDTLNTKDFLYRNKLYRKDYSTNKEGVTLACVLLFGTDEQIVSVVPSFKFELVKRVENVDRYDDRITLTTNLLDCMQIASAFVEKHLPSPFYLEGTQRIDLRSNIFREVIANMLVHKEYTGAAPTQLIITKDEIHAENSNKPHIRGIITPKNTTNYSKNPNIIRIFRGIGYVEDFGTGIPKLFKYCKAYSGQEPVIEDGDIFSFTLKHNFFPLQAKSTDTPSGNKTSDHVSVHVSDHVSDHVAAEEQILAFCAVERSLKEIADFTKYKNRIYFKRKFINPLLDKGLLKLKFPGHPRIPGQKYIATVKNERK